MTRRAALRTGAGAVRSEPGGGGGARKTAFGYKRGNERTSGKGTSCCCRAAERRSPQFALREAGCPPRPGLRPPAAVTAPADRNSIPEFL